MVLLDVLRELTKLGIFTYNFIVLAFTKSSYWQHFKTTLILAYVYFFFFFWLSRMFSSVYAYSSCSGITIYMYTQLALVYCLYAPSLVEIWGLYWWRKPWYVSRDPGKGHLVLSWQSWPSHMPTSRIEPFMQLWRANALPNKLTWQSWSGMVFKICIRMLWWNVPMALCQKI